MLFRSYRREDGIDNVNYGNNNYNMICETIYTLAENYEHPYRSGKISRDAQQAVRAYIDAIYDNAWKKQMDEWIIHDGVVRMYLDGIKFLVLPNLLWPFDPDNADQWRNAFDPLIPDHYLFLDPQRTPQAVSGSYPCVNNDPGYHSTPEGQRVIADIFCNHIRSNFSLP